MFDQWKLFKKDGFLFFLIFCITFTIYLITTCPASYMEDGAEFVTVAATLGIGHPPGFPLYILLGKIFSYLPMGSVAFRINLMSGFFAALAISFLFLIIRHLIKNRAIAFFTVLIFAFTAQFWLRSVYTEAYTLNALFLVSTLYLLILWSETGKESHLLWFSFLLGLSLTHHHLMVLAVIPYLFFIMYRRFSILKNPKTILKIFLVFLLGLSIYLYVPLRSFGQPAVEWSDTEKLNNFIDLATGTLHPNLSFPNIKAFFQYFLNFFEQLFQQYTIPLFLIGFLGIYYFFRKNFRYFILIMGIFLFTWLPFVYIYARTFNALDIWFLGELYIPAFLIFSIFIASGFVYILELIKKIKIQLAYKTIIIIFSVFLIAAPTYLLVKNYSQNNLSSFYLSYDYTKSILESIEPRGVLVINVYNDGITFDNLVFTLGYLQYVEKFRTDVEIVAYTQFYPNVPSVPVFPADLIFSKKSNSYRFIVLAWREICQKQNRPCYAVDFSLEAEKEGYLFRSNGIIYRVFRDEKQAEEFKQHSVSIPLRNDYLLDTPKDTFAKNLLSRYHFDQASYYIERNDKAKSLEHLLKAIELEEVPFSEKYKNFLLHRDNLIIENQL